MPEQLAARSALHGVASTGRYGNSNGAPGITLSERVGLGLATVATRKGKAETLAATIRRLYGPDLPAASRVLAGPAVAFMGTAPGQWFAVSEALPNCVLTDDLAEKLAGLASITDQSDGQAIVRISGSRAREVLAKGLPIDLHPKAFHSGDAATSVFGHVGIRLWQVDQKPTYDISVFRSFAETLWRRITESAVEFGYEVVLVD